MLQATKYQKEAINLQVIRMNRFLQIFTLRQGTILIAIHQIAVTFFALVLLIVAIPHVNEVMRLLNHDMEDDAERRNIYEYYKDELNLDDDIFNTNNQKLFRRGQYTASVTALELYLATFVTAIYLVCCISLLLGAINYRKEFIANWIPPALICLIALGFAIFVGDNLNAVREMCGGKVIYRLMSAGVLIGYIYSLFTVCCFYLELYHNVNDGRIFQGERMLLIDQTAQSNVLSTSQLNKLKMDRTRFV